MSTAIKFKTFFEHFGLNLTAFSILASVFGLAADTLKNLTNLKIIGSRLKNPNNQKTF